MAKLVPENHPALHTIAEEVTAEDFSSGAVTKIVKGLREAIKTYDVDGYAAVAIAAPQIGVSKRIFIIEDQLSRCTEVGPSDINTYSSVDFSVYNMEVKVTKLQKKLLFIILPIMALTAIFFFAITTDKFDPRPQLSNPSKNSLYLDATQPIEARVADLLSYMTLEEKIGQMTLVEKDSIKEPSDIATYHLGALLSGSGSKPAENTPEGWKKMIDGYQAEARQSRLGIPLLYGSDAVHGHAHVPGSTVFPHAISLGATNNPSLVEAVARATLKIWLVLV